MAQDTIRVVLVGCGGMANTWVSVALDTVGLELVGLIDLDRSQAEKMADKHALGREVVFGSLAEAVKATRADAVFDVTVPKAYPIVTLDALGLGCRVLGELAEAHCEFYIGAHFGGFRDEMAHPLLGDMSIHRFDMARCLTGRAPIAVTCHAWDPVQSW